MKNESYCNFNLPAYFDFSSILNDIDNLFHQYSENLNSCFQVNNAKQSENCNYMIYTNKDGKLAYRPFQLINPIIYVYIVREITKNENWTKIQNRFRDFSSDKIECTSIPLEMRNRSNTAGQILNWWEKIEQKSISLFMEFDFLFETDIADCYSSIYTHSIAWGVETKEVAKQHRRHFENLGNTIDTLIQCMQNGQTNGIPQGSVLMDFIAEIVLGYIDELLTKRLCDENITEYKILRYRDDYKIFTNNQNTGFKILKMLSTILVPFGLKLNTSKTKQSSDIILNSIKPDKLDWFNQIGNIEKLKTYEKRLLLIYQHSLKHLNSGSIAVALLEFSKDLENDIQHEHKKYMYEKYINQIVSITLKIMIDNPKTIPICCSIISNLLSQVENLEGKNFIINSMYNKINKQAYSDYAIIWLQRITRKEFDLEISKFIDESYSMKLWDVSWVGSNSSFNRPFISPSIIDRTKFEQMTEVLFTQEIDIFNYSNL